MAYTCDGCGYEAHWDIKEYQYPLDGWLLVESKEATWGGQEFKIAIVKSQIYYPVCKKKQLTRSAEGKE